jgi:hypothetical protein
VSSVLCKRHSFSFSTSLINGTDLSGGLCGDAWKIATEFRWWKQLGEVNVNDHIIVLCHYAIASGITHFEDRGICTGIRTAAYSTIQPHCPWMSESIHTTFAPGTSMRSQPEWARSPDIEQSVSIQRGRPSAVFESNSDPGPEHLLAHKEQDASCT